MHKIGSCMISICGSKLIVLHNSQDLICAFYQFVSRHLNAFFENVWASGQLAWLTESKESFIAASMKLPSTYDSALFSWVFGVILLALFSPSAFTLTKTFTTEAHKGFTTPICKWKYWNFSFEMSEIYHEFSCRKRYTVIIANSEIWAWSESFDFGFFPFLFILSFIAHSYLFTLYQVSENSNWQFLFCAGLSFMFSNHWAGSYH